MLVWHQKLTLASFSFAILFLIALVGCAVTETPTPTVTPEPTLSPTPVATATPFPAPSMRSTGSQTYCDSTTLVTFEGKDRRFCTTHRLGSSAPLTGIGEIMTDTLINDAGDVFEWTAAVCDPSHNKCPAFIWAQKGKQENLYALPRLWPNLVDKRLVAPLLVWNKSGNPQNFANWQVLLVDRSNGATIQQVSNPWIQLNDKDLLEFSPESGYFEVEREAGSSLTPLGKMIGLQLIEPVPATATFDAIGFYQFPEDDTPKMEKMLGWIKGTVPKWHQFILDQRPFRVYLNLALPQRGWGGATFCCSTSNLGTQTGRIELGREPRGDIIDDLTLASTLVHEATHVRDRRSGLGDILNPKNDCRINERSAVESEQAFLSDILISNADVRERTVAGRLLNQAREILAEGSFNWNPRCN